MRTYKETEQIAAADRHQPHCLNSNDYVFARRQGSTLGKRMSTAIRYLSTCFDSELFAAAELERTVHIYRRSEANPIRTIETIMDAGGSRLQIIPDLDILISGAFEKNGIQCNSISSGEVLWTRKDLKRVQNIRYCPHSGLVSCLFEGREGVALVPETGEEAGRYRGVKNVFASPYGIERLEEARSYRLVTREGIVRRIAPLSFGILDAAFSEHVLAISEAASVVRLIDSTNGDEIGRYCPVEGFHMLSLHSSTEPDEFIGVLWGYKLAGPCFLVHLDISGKELHRFEFSGGYGARYFHDRRSVLSKSGIESSWIDSRILCQYAFPETN